MSFILQPANLNNVIGVLGAANGGTGLTSSGALGNVLTSDGTTWQSTSTAGSGGAQPFVTQITGNNQLPAANYSPTDAAALT